MRSGNGRVIRMAAINWENCAMEQCKEALYSYCLFGEREWSREEQIQCLYTLSNHAEQHYRSVWIPKKNGKKRRLLIPDPILSEVQRNILSEILLKIPVSEYAKAYKKGVGLRQMADAHRGKSTVMRLDIRDFFGNITFFMVYQQVFSSCRFPPAIGTLLTHLCCCRDVLPQGAPTSPAISNLVLKPFDDYMGQWCRARGIAYSRYCDDMVFSGEFQPKTVKNKARGFLASMGFSLNGEKSAVRAASQRQTVTGVVVNEKIQVPRDYRRKVHQEVYYCRRYGVDDHRKRMGQQGEAVEKERYLMSLAGKLNYILQINPKDRQARADLEVIKEIIRGS